MPCTVYIQNINDYSLSRLQPTLENLLTQALSPLPANLNILIKPNFISRQNCTIACTHPALIYAACKYFLDLGHTVSIGDSPAFGSARSIAASTGLYAYLSDLQVPVVNLKKPVPCHLFKQESIAVSSQALEADLIVNIPKLKAHSQMRVSGALKNLFGCVPGMRKAWAHARYGERDHYFEQMFFALLQKLPQTINILDGIQAMHKTGPIQGSLLQFNLLAVSKDPVALDTAIYTALKLSPEQVPLWAEACRLQLPGAIYRDIEFPLLCAKTFPGKDFELPQQLNPVNFRPLRLFTSALKRCRHWLAENFLAGS